MPFRRVHVSGYHVWLDFVGRHILRRQRVRHRIDHLVEMHCAIAITL
jgi:hypothetical protein